MRLVLGLLALTGLAFSGGPALAAKKKPILVDPTQRVAPPPITDTENIVYLDLSTGGRVTIRLYPNVAPKMVDRFKTLTRQHFYDGLTFHRVIEGFMAQTGDPKGDGTGGSTLPDLPAEFNWMPHVRGAVSAAREGAAPEATAEEKTKAENSANSQFFIVTSPKLSLDKKYTVFGRVIAGMEYVDAVAKGEPPASPSRVLHAYVAADGPPAYTPPPPPPPVAQPAQLAPAPVATPVPVKPAPKQPVARKPVAKK